MSSRLLEILGLFCRISPLLQGSFAKETYNFKAPTHRSHPIDKTLRYTITIYIYNIYTITIESFYNNYEAGIQSL